MSQQLWRSRRSSWAPLPPRDPLLATANPVPPLQPLLPGGNPVVQLHQFEVDLLPGPERPVEDADCERGHQENSDPAHPDSSAILASTTNTDQLGHHEGDRQYEVRLECDRVELKNSAIRIQQPRQVARAESRQDEPNSPFAEADQ